MNSIPYDGLITFWNLGQWSHRDALESGLEKLGFAGCVPQHRTHNACLKDAMVDVMESNQRIIRALKEKDGYAVVQESRGQNENWYTHVMSARIDPKTNVITFDGRLAEAEANILARYNAHLG